MLRPRQSIDQRKARASSGWSRCEATPMKHRLALGGAFSRLPGTRWPRSRDIGGGEGVGMVGGGRERATAGRYSPKWHRRSMNSPVLARISRVISRSVTGLIHLPPPLRSALPRVFYAGWARGQVELSRGCERRSRRGWRRRDQQGMLKWLAGATRLFTSGKRGTRIRAPARPPLHAIDILWRRRHSRTTSIDRHYIGKGQEDRFAVLFSSSLLSISRSRLIYVSVVCLVIIYRSLC